MITYEIRKKFEDGTDVSYFTSYDFDETMQTLWQKYKWEKGCYFVIKIPGENSQNVIKIIKLLDKYKKEIIIII